MRNTPACKNLNGELWLNVASATAVLDGFVNLDNHIFIRMLQFYAVARWIVPQKYEKLLQAYYESSQRGLLVQHDCRKTLPFSSNSVDHILCSHFLEHVFPQEMERIVGDFFRVLKSGATLHVIVPDIKAQVEKYLEGNKRDCELAADEFITGTLLSRASRGSLKYRLLEFCGAYGLQHYWMYDHKSMARKLRDIGLTILDANDTPSAFFRRGDNSVHVVCRKD